LSDLLPIALDAMGGDLGPSAVIGGAQLAHIRFPDIRFVFYGDEKKITPLLDAPENRSLKACSAIVHTDVMVEQDEKPSIAVRAGKQSSMRLAIDSVERGESSGVVSSGNTGALMAMSKIALRTLPGISRPAIAGTFPTLKGECIMLDLGANVESDGEELVQFAIMGDAFARAVLRVDSPTIGLLNVGSEEMKGHEEVRTAAALLKKTTLPLNFHGFVEGNDIALGTVDVVVTDGFSGNIALKTAEGTARLMITFLKDALSSSLMSKLGYLLAKPGIETLRDRMDPRKYNGAMFLGLNGIVIKSHGSSDAFGFSHAIATAVALAKHRINQKIIEEIRNSGTAHSRPASENPVEKKPAVSQSVVAG